MKDSWFGRKQNKVTKTVQAARQGAAELPVAWEVPPHQMGFSSADEPALGAAGGLILESTLGWDSFPERLGKDLGNVHTFQGVVRL